MKIILAIFCGLMVLFAGGCALILIADGSYYSSDSGSVALSVVPGSVAALNVVMLLGMFGKKEPQRWAFYLLAAVDVLAAAALLLLSLSIAGEMGDIFVLSIPLIGLLLLKAWLTIRVVRNIPPRTEA
jgi:hypothetical protein